MRVVQPNGKIDEIFIERIGELMGDARSCWTRDAVAGANFLNGITVAEDASPRKHLEDFVLPCVRVKWTRCPAGRSARDIRTEPSGRQGLPHAAPMTSVELLDFLHTIDVHDVGRGFSPG